VLDPMQDQIGRTTQFGVKVYLDLKALSFLMRWHGQESAQVRIR